jgi:cell division protein ZapC
VHAIAQWHWVYDPEQQQLQIELEQGIVHSAPYKSSRLVPLHAMRAAFSTDDAEQFQSFYDALESSGIVAAQTALEASLNYLIFSRYGRPQMPQSWYFQTAEHAPTSLEVGQLVSLNSGMAESICAITSTDGEFVECMVLGGDFPLSDIKTLRQFDVIKVMPNRLQALHESHENSTDSHLKQA